MEAFHTGHARSDRREHQNAFQSFAKNENADVEKRHSRAGVGAGRIGRAVRSNSLPDQHGGDEKRGCNHADTQSKLHFALTAYHRHKPDAGGRLLFFSGCLRDC
jgi:hypothetical protein